MKATASRLNWRRVKAGLYYQWEAGEHRDGTPDFLVVQTGHTYRMRTRGEHQWTLHDTLAEAQKHAEVLAAQQDRRV